MSTLQVANIWFESTGNNRVQYTGANAFQFVIGGSNAMVINTSAVTFPGGAPTYASNGFTVGTAFYVVANGNVGVSNSTPADKFHVQGNIIATGVVTSAYSDQRLKTFVYKIDNAVEKIRTLNGWVYQPSELSMKLMPDQKNELNLGVVAQEVEMQFPEVVSIAPFDRNANGTSVSGENYLTVNYERLVPVLIEAIKELNEKIIKLETKIG